MNFNIDSGVREKIHSGKKCSEKKIKGSWTFGKNTSSLILLLL